MAIFVFLCFGAILHSSALAQTATPEDDSQEKLAADLNLDYFTETEDETTRLAQNTSDDSGERVNEESESVSCNYLTENLRIDQNNDPKQVQKLQAFLQSYGYEDVAVTGNFGETTLRAVESFQSEHADEVLNPWGYQADETTGYVYITTRKKINEIYCNQELSFTESNRQEIAAYREKINQWRREGASFETPQYLAEYYDSQSAVAGDSTDAETTQAIEAETGDKAVSSESAATSAEDESETSSNESGFFSRLFGSDNNTTTADQTGTSAESVEDEIKTENEATGTRDQTNALDTTEDSADETDTTTAKKDDQADAGTSSVFNQAAASVYTGVNSIIGFLLSPTFLLVLLVVLILLLIATLFEDEKQLDTGETGAIGDWQDDDEGTGGEDVDDKNPEAESDGDEAQNK